MTQLTKIVGLSTTEADVVNLGSKTAQAPLLCTKRLLTSRSVACLDRWAKACSWIDVELCYEDFPYDKLRYLLDHHMAKVKRGTIIIDGVNTFHMQDHIGAELLSQIHHLKIKKIQKYQW